MTPDKGDIYTLTLDHWSKRKSRQLWGFIFHIADNPQFLNYFFFCFGKLQKASSCVSPLYGSFSEQRSVRVGAAVTVCHQWCAEVCGLVQYVWDGKVGLAQETTPLLALRHGGLP